MKLGNDSYICNDDKIIVYCLARPPTPPPSPRTALFGSSVAPPANKSPINVLYENYSGLAFHCTFGDGSPLEASQGESELFADTPIRPLESWGPAEGAQEDWETLHSNDTSHRCGTLDLNLADRRGYVSAKGCWWWCMYTFRIGVLSLLRRRGVDIAFVCFYQ